MKRYLFLFLGTLFLLLGIVGIVLPLLPTTPFLLLSAACYMRSSEKLYHWLTHHKTFGPLINNYLQHRALSLTTKITAISTLWLFILFATFVVTHLLWVQIALIVIATGVTFYLLSLNTMKKEV
ncbi:MAG: YbaN family protein [Fibrobacterales bacterium]